MEEIDKESLAALPIQDPEDGEERSYSDREIKLRNNFVKEYLKDYDPVGAAQRVGYARSIAREYAIRFMDEPYVARMIKQLEEAPIEEVDTETMKKRIMAGLYKEANNFGLGATHAGRVAAWAKLAQLQGMEPASRVKNEITGADGAALGGMFVLPGLMTPEDWEKAAATQQQDLVDGKIAQAKQVAPPSID